MASSTQEHRPCAISVWETFFYRVLEAAEEIERKRAERLLREEENQARREGTHDSHAPLKDSSQCSA